MNENSIYCDTTTDDEVGQANKECSSLCHMCEYVEYYKDDYVLLATCDLKDSICPDVGVKICPAAKIIFETYFRDVFQCIEWLTLSSVHVYKSDRNSVIASIDNFLDEDCKHNRYSVYPEKRLNDEYSHVKICIDCGHYNLMEK